MSSRSITHSVVSVTVGLVTCLAAATNPRVVRADPVVETGWNLFESTSPTTFNGEAFEGVPLGTFDFGGTIGVQDTGTADTIVERLGVATVPSAPLPATAAPIDIELVALQLVSVAPIDFGAGLDFYFITLQTAAPSVGEMTITFDDPASGTFSSFIDVAFDVRKGDLAGDIVTSALLRLSSSDVPWDRTSPADALEIDGVNHLLNGLDITTDFWVDDFTEEHPSGARHSVTLATPEPGTLSLLAISTLAFARRRRPA